MNKSFFLYLLKCYTLSIACLALSRLLFVLQFFTLKINFAEVTKTFAIGFIFDSCVISSTIIVCLSISLIFKVLLSLKKEANLFLWLFATCLLIVLFINVIDIFFFKSYGVRLNNQALELFKDFSTISEMILNTFPVLRVILIFGIVSTCIITILLKYYKSNIYTDKTNIKWIFITFIVFCSLSFLYVGPPLWYLSSFSSNPAVNQGSMNGTYTFIKSIHQENQYKSEIDRFKFEKDNKLVINKLREVIKENDETFLSDDFPTSRKKNNKNQPNLKNIVIIILESFSASKVGCITSGTGYSPHFDTLSKDGALFTNFFANGPRTQHAIVSIISSFPPVIVSSFIRRKGINEFETLGNLLSDVGYETNFIYGGDIQYDNMNMFLQNAGFSSVTDQKSFKNFSFQNEWGVCDEDLFQKAFEKIDATPKPHLSVILTLSNHAPYDIPSTFRYPDSLNKQSAAFLYSDYCVNNFIKKCRNSNWYDNTIFFILGDHGESWQDGDHQFKIFHIPLLILNSEISNGVYMQRCTQIDIAPSILNFVGYNKTYHFIGSDLRNLSDNNILIFRNIGNNIFYIKNNIVIELSNQTNNFNYYNLTPDNHLNSNVLQENTKEITENFKTLLQGLSYIFWQGKYKR